MALKKLHRQVADAIIKCEVDAHLKLGLTQDQFNAIVDRDEVREFVDKDRERQVFLAGQEAILLLRSCLGGAKRKSLYNGDLRAIELALKACGGVKGRKVAESKLEDFVDKEVVKN